MWEREFSPILLFVPTVVTNYESEIRDLFLMDKKTYVGFSDSFFSGFVSLDFLTAS